MGMLSRTIVYILLKGHTEKETLYSHLNDRKSHQKEKVEWRDMKRTHPTQNKVLNEKVLPINRDFWFLSRTARGRHLWMLRSVHWYLISWNWSQWLIPFFGYLSDKHFFGLGNPVLCCTDFGKAPAQHQAPNISGRSVSELFHIHMVTTCSLSSSLSSE